MKYRLQWPIFEVDECDYCGHRTWAWRWPVRRVRKPVPLTAEQIRTRDAMVNAVNSAVRMMQEYNPPITALAATVTIPRVGDANLLGMVGAQYTRASERAEDERILGILGATDGD